MARNALRATACFPDGAWVRGNAPLLHIQPESRDVIFSMRGSIVIGDGYASLPPAGVQVRRRWRGLISIRTLYAGPCGKELGD